MTIESKIAPVENNRSTTDLFNCFHFFYVYAALVQSFHSTKPQIPHL